MSITRTVTIHCDRCPQWADPGAHTQTAASARQAARSVGFVRTKVDGITLDLCSVCSSTPQETT
jgi:hypothetical protein